MSTPRGRDDDPFRHYSWRHRVEAWVSQTLFDRVVYTVRRGLLKGMRRKGGLAWIPDRVGSAKAETPETRFWRRLTFTGMVVYDVGAFHGLLALHFARTADAVYCFEPSRRNRARLEENLALNRSTNVFVQPFALGASSDTRPLVASRAMPGGASAESVIAGGIRDRAGATEVETVDVRPLDLLIRKLDLPIPDFVKIDVEGLEAEVLRGGERLFRERRPRVFLEMHGETVNEKKRKVAEIVELLVGFGYDAIRHIESGVRIGPGNSEMALRGHLYAHCDGG